MKLNVDIDKRSKGESAPDGTYIVEVMKIEEGTSKTKGSPQLVVEMEIIEGPYTGSKITDFLPLSEASEFRRSNFFYACGYESGVVQVDTAEIAKYDGDRLANDSGAVLKAKKVSSAANGRTNINIFYSRADHADEAPADAPAQAEAPPVSRPSTSVRTITRR